MAMTTVVHPNTLHDDGMDVEGNELITFSCPSCGKSIETRPAATGQTLGALSECRHCRAIFKKTVIGEHAYGVKLEGPSKVSN